MNVKTLLVASGIMFSMTTLAQSSFSFTTPPQVESVLNLSGDNKNELKTVLNYYAQVESSLFSYWEYGHTLFRTVLLGNTRR